MLRYKQEEGLLEDAYSFFCNLFQNFAPSLAEFVIGKGLVEMTQNLESVYGHPNRDDALNILLNYECLIQLKKGEKRRTRSVCLILFSLN
jgi:hypothetical protein